MRERHWLLLCRSCEAPMARQEDTCWGCGANWVASDRAWNAPAGITSRLADEARPRGQRRASARTASTAPGRRGRCAR